MQTGELSRDAYETISRLSMGHNPARIKDGWKLATCFSRCGAIRRGSRSQRRDQRDSAQLDSTRHDSARRRLLDPRFSAAARFGSVHLVPPTVQGDLFFSFRFFLYFSSPWIKADLDLSKSYVTRHVPSMPLAAASLRRAKRMLNKRKEKEGKPASLPGQSHSGTLEFVSLSKARRST